MTSIITLPEPFDIVDPRETSARRLARDETLAHAGDPSRGPVFVAEGTLEMRRHGASGQRIVLHRAGAGTILAEASLFSDRYHCDIVAVAPTRAVTIRKASVLDLIGTDAAFAAALIRRLAEEVQGLRRRLEILTIPGAEDRVLAALTEFGQPDTVIAFAARIDLSHEAVYRALSSLVRRGLVERHSRGRYRIRAANR